MINSKLKKFAEQMNLNVLDNEETYYLSLDEISINDYLKSHVKEDESGIYATSISTSDETHSISLIEDENKNFVEINFIDNETGNYVVYSFNDVINEYVEELIVEF
jgi:hypothetical protein